MAVTRNVILDLLPLYLADEVSADTRALVEKYLESDPELAGIAEQSAAIELPEDIPVPLTMENKMQAYREARRLMLLRTIVLAVTIAFIFLCLIILVVVAIFFVVPA
jgi:sensor domain CHASE-containing protein